MVSWVDAPSDAAWTSPDPAGVLRAIDRFRPVPDVPARAASWAEWLYFNGRSSSARFYLTFLVGPARADGRRTAGVRLQLDRGHGVESFNATAALDQDGIDAAPELTIGANRITLDGLRYNVALDLKDRKGRRVTGVLSIAGAADQLMPPIQIHGAGGWQSGYVVPVMSGVLGGTLLVDGERVSFDLGVGYHDHNWGFWEGVSWQWGQVQHEEISIVYGRVFPPRDAADLDGSRVSLAAIGPGGPIGYATRVTSRRRTPRRLAPQRINRAAQSPHRSHVGFSVETCTNRMQAGPLTSGRIFLQVQLGGTTVAGTQGTGGIGFSGAGSCRDVPRGLVNRRQRRSLAP